MSEDQNPAPQPGGRYPVTGGLRRVIGVRRLEERIDALEAEVAGYREAHQRFAELIDVVQELLLPAAGQDRERIARLLQRYTDDLEG